MQQKNCYLTGLETFFTLGVFFSGDILFSLDLTFARVSLSNKSARHSMTRKLLIEYASFDQENVSLPILCSIGLLHFGSPEALFDHEIQFNSMQELAPCV